MFFLLFKCKFLQLSQCHYFQLQLLIYQIAFIVKYSSAESIIFSWENVGLCLRLSSIENQAHPHKTYPDKKMIYKRYINTQLSAGIALSLIQYISIACYVFTHMWGDLLYQKKVTNLILHDVFYGFCIPTIRSEKISGVCLLIDGSFIESKIYTVGNGPFRPTCLCWPRLLPVVVPLFSA